MKFSIITSCYNQQRFLKDCIESVLAQTHDDWEHIIVNDCSTDDCASILSNLQHSRMRVILHESRKFCSSSYATALSHITGDIVGVLDSDDILKQNAMSVIIKRYKAHPQIDFIYTQHHWCDASLAKQRTGVSSAPSHGRSLAEMTQVGKHCYSHWRTFRAKMKDKGVLFPEGLQVSVDKNLGFTLEELGRGAFLPKKLYYYRYYKGNMSLLQGGLQKQTTKRLAKQYIQNRKAKGQKAFPIITIK